ncbi:MAG TPA: M14 family zinc carboxypeptidase, partial [Gemmatimonadaceae bacterium]|nr:M14 family zinc carboxypeptidase [Gemmatimonadaceae bacterium]
MRSASLALLLTLAVSACAPTPARMSARVPLTTPNATAVAQPCCFAQGLEIADRFRVAAIDERRFTANEYWGAMAGALASPRFRTQEIGRSVQGRPLTAIHVGTGPVTVLAWSQMHGDESTASMALLDVVAWLASEQPDALRDRLLGSITLTLVPVLNPDGAQLFQRQNALGVDINRDARRLSTPEARALKGLHDQLKPDFGFNLHDQNSRNRAGPSGKQVGISLLAPAISADGRYDAVRSRARLVAARIAHNLATEIPGQVSRYDDAFNPRAFGDLVQTWGTSTVLIESGALAADPQKQRLRRLNAAALVDALLAIGDGSYARADRAWYDDLQQNRGGAVDVLVRGARVVGLGPTPYLVDVAINYGDGVAQTGPRVNEVG